MLRRETLFAATFLLCYSSVHCRSFNPTYEDSSRYLGRFPELQDSFIPRQNVQQRVNHQKEQPERLYYDQNRQIPAQYPDQTFPEESPNDKEQQSSDQYPDQLVQKDYSYDIQQQSSDQYPNEEVREESPYDNQQQPSSQLPQKSRKIFPDFSQNVVSQQESIGEIHKSAIQQQEWEKKDGYDEQTAGTDNWKSWEQSPAGSELSPGKSDQQEIEPEYQEQETNDRIRKKQVKQGKRESVGFEQQEQEQVPMEQEISRFWHAARQAQQKEEMDQETMKQIPQMPALDPFPNELQKIDRQREVRNSEQRENAGRDTHKITKQATSDKGIPDGYEEFPGIGIYKFHSEGASSFRVASRWCQDEGAHLAIANSEDEAKVFQSLWEKHEDTLEHDAYVGISKRNPENEFKTVFGGTIYSTGYVAWRPGQPDNLNGVERCVSFHRLGGYNDIPCYGIRPFICELHWQNEQ